MPSKQASWFANVNPNVFLGTVIIIALFLAVVVIAPSSFELLTQQLILLVGSMSYRLPSFLSYSFILPVLRLDVLN